MNIGQVIAQNRKSKGLSQIDVAKELGRFDIHVGNAAISAWEKGINMPTAEQLLALCQILEINDIYTEFIGENPHDPFRNLNDETHSGISMMTESLKSTTILISWKHQENTIRSHPKSSLWKDA